MLFPESSSRYTAPPPPPPKTPSSAPVQRRHCVESDAVRIRTQSEPTDPNAPLSQLRWAPAKDAKSKSSLNSSLSTISGKVSNLALNGSIPLTPEQKYGSISSRRYVSPIREESPILEEMETGDSTSTHSSQRADGTRNAGAIDPAMLLKLDEIFKLCEPHVDHNELKELKDDLACLFARKNIGPKKLDALLSTAHSVDTGVGLFSGAASALGFIVGGFASTAMVAVLKPFLSDLDSNISNRILLFVPGTTTAIVDRTLNSVLRDTNVGYYTKGDPDNLQHAMQVYIERAQRTMGAEVLHQTAPLVVWYSMRNVVRICAAPLAAHFGQQQNVDTAIDGIGGLPAGAMAQWDRNDGDRHAGLMGPHILLARKNVESLLETLEHAPLSKERSWQFIKRACKGIANTPRILLHIPERLCTKNGMIMITYLAGGFALIPFAKEAVRDTWEGSSEESLAFTETAASMAYLAAGLYAGLALFPALDYLPEDGFSRFKEWIRPSAGNNQKYDVAIDSDRSQEKRYPAATYKAFY